MKLTTKLALRNIKINRTWSLATLLGIVLSVSLMTTIVTLGYNFIRMIQVDTAKFTGNHIAQINNPNTRLMHELNNISEISHIVTINSLGTFEIDDQIMKPIITMSENDFKYLNFQLIAGEYPKNNSELIVSKEVYDIFASQNISTNDTISLNIHDNETVNGESQTSKIITNDFTITGYYQATSKYYKSFASAITVDTPNDLDQKIYLFSDHIDKKVIETINTVTHPYLNDETTIQLNTEYLLTHGITDNNSILNILNIIIAITAFILLLIMSASSILISNAFLIASKQRTKQLAMLSSVGATKYQRIQVLYKEAGLITCLGILLGLVAGVGFLNIIFKNIKLWFPSISYFFFDKPIYPYYLVIIVIFTTLITVFIALNSPIRNLRKLNLVESLKDYHFEKINSNVISKKQLLFKPKSYEWLLANKNYFRNRKSYRPTIVALTVSIVLFLVSSNFVYLISDASTNYDTTKNHHAFNFYAKPSNNWDSTFNKLIGLGYHDILISQYYYTDVKFENNNAKISNQFINNTNTVNLGFVVMPDAAFNYFIKDYQIDSLAENEIIFKDSIFDGVSLTILTTYENGDSLIYQDIESDSYVNEFKIGEKLDSKNVFVYFPNVAIILSESQWDKYLQNHPKNTDLKEYWHVLLNPSTDRISQNTNVIDYETELRNIFSISDDFMFTSELGNIQRMQQTVAFITLILYGMLGLVSLICISNILNTMSNSIQMRRREFAMLQSVGLTHKGVIKILCFESIIYGSKVLVYGLPLALIFNLIINVLVAQSISNLSGLNFKSYLLVIAIVIVIILCSIYYTTRKLKNDNIVETIRRQTL